MTYDSIVSELFPNVPALNVLVGLNGYSKEKCVAACGRIGISKYVDMFSTLPELYSSWNRNQHHWTTDFVWNRVFPLAMEFIDEKIDPDRFELVERFSECKFDISFHRWNGPDTFKFVDYDGGYSKEGTHDVLRDLEGLRSDGGSITDYHRLFIGAHRNCHIYNFSSTNGKKIFMNADSMCIPLIPLLAPFADEILIYDNHVKNMPYSNLEKFSPTHYLMVNTMLNVFSSNVLNKLLTWKQKSTTQHI